MTYWRSKSHLIWLLALGYFAFYVPYSALTKALTKGWIPGIEGPVGAFEILPATALGSVAGMLLFVGLTGWWRNARRRRVAGFSIPVAGRETLIAAAFTAVIIGTTTMNYAFAGISIVLALLLMRGGVLILSPIVDLLRHRRVAWYSWTALTLSLLAVAIALSDVGSYRLTWIAAVNLIAYLIGYLVRFQVMAEHAKADERSINRRYFIEEHMAATPILVAALAVQALVGQGEIALTLRQGFTSFLLTDAAPWAFLIGLLYEGLFIFGSLVYLDPREFTFCVPVNRGSSLLAGLVATYGLFFLVGAAPPRASALLALALILGAMAVLAIAPRLRLRALATSDSVRRLLARGFLFVCGGNTARSPMAAAICREELGRRLGVPPDMLGELGISVRSAGLSAHEGEPAASGARRALGQLGIRLRPHHARQVTAAMLGAADLVFCMTRGQRQALVALHPGSADKIRVLDSRADIPDPLKPGGGSLEQSARHLRAALVRRFNELGVLTGSGARPS